MLRFILRQRILTIVLGIGVLGRSAAADDVARQITVGVWSWPEELRAAARAYEEGRPGVDFTFLLHESGKIEGFRQGKVDLLAYENRFSGYLGGREIKLFPQAFPEPLPETTVAYRPLAVCVHPENPLRSIGRAPLGLLASERDKTWSDLGRADDGPVSVYVYWTSRAASAILGKDDSGAVLRSYWPQVNMSYDDRVVKALAEDRNGIALWYHDRQFAASGLKVLPLQPERGDAGPARPSDAAAVASGRYWLRTPLRIMVHPAAGEEARRFARWLTTPEAGKAMLAIHRESSVPATYPSPIGHVAFAGEDVPRPEVVASPPPDVRQPGPSGPIDGAVAVLPTEALSMFFLMAKPSHHAVYEQGIFEALESDGRLDLVDRTELERVLQERKLGRLRPSGGRAGPLVAADVFVLPYVVTRRETTCLRVRAVHGPTACLLGQLELPIDPADPLYFWPPLPQAVKRWWPGVLGQLEAIRKRPIWTLGDVYTASTVATDRATLVRRALESQLSADARVFFAPRVPLSWTQQEVLMELAGLSRPESGRFSPAVDYRVEARLAGPDRLQIRVLSGGMVPVAATEFVPENPEEHGDKLARDAAAWLDRQVANHPDRQPGRVDPASAPSDNWARRQAEFEITAGEQLRAEAYRLEREAHARYVDNGTVRMPPEVARQIESTHRRAREHFQRAGQLAPTWEKAALAALGQPADLFGQIHAGASSEGNRDLPPGEELRACEQFLATFPDSKHAEQTLQIYTRGCLAFADDARLPPVLNDRPLRIHFYRKGLDGYRRYLQRYTLTGKADSEFRATMNFGHYLYWLKEYIEYAEPDEAKRATLVADWSRCYDAYPDRAPHSDFVRLLLLAQQDRRGPFIELLTDLQRRWPDPRHPQWKETTGLIDTAIFRLFREVGSGNSSFQLWHRGRRGIGDLPAVGYSAK